MPDDPQEGASTAPEGTDTGSALLSAEELTALLLALLARGTDDARTAAEHLSTGIATPTDFVEALRALLLDVHTQSAVLGRQLAGVDGPITELDHLYGATVMAEQEAYLLGFLADIEAGVYTLPDGTLNLSRLQWRASLYVDRAWGTANQAWVDALPDTTLFRWVLGGAEEHCEDCPALAERSPFTQSGLPTVPGACDTACRGGCKCHLETSTGARSFRRPQED